MLNVSVANDIYTVLVREAGAREGDLPGFLQYASTHEPSEWRFQGNLGFGGKYYFSANRVNCYSEDQTDKTRAIIARTNAALEKIAGIEA